MAQLGDPTLHFYMTRGMARMIGVNLGDALRDGRLKPADYANMVTRCRGCPHASSCQDIMAQNTNLASPPEQCPNRLQLRQLRLQ
ncbi:DUF6455 family protein [Primorskyibacter sp. S187A]|uniref:DUF6455 family protein n=1 Tax=Primorskyibacter sp. S187A TaxID=3415130 RepID=UPI003C7E6809